MRKLIACGTAETQKALFGADRIELEFRGFHHEHPEVYRLLVDLARQARAKGKERIGIKTLYEVARWNFDVGGDPESGFKLNNNFTSLYARMIQENEPDLAGMFETRERRAG